MTSEMNSPDFVLACHICKKHGFSNRTKLRNHLKARHCLHLASVYIGRPTAEITSQATLTAEIYYLCPSCVSFFETIEQVGEHIKVHLSVPTNASNADNSDESLEALENTTSDESGDENQVITIPTSVTVPASRSVTEIAENFRRSHEDAILYACQQTKDSDENQKKTMFILDAINLKPFAIVNKDGVEQNALAHPIVIDKAISERSFIEPTLPSKRTFYDMDSNEKLCVNCSYTNPSYFQTLLTMSPYVKLFQKRKYVELSNDLCDLLNNDWTFHPHMKYFAAQLLAGSVIRNSVNGEVIMANTIEVYGRKKSVDLHREPFGTKKQSAIPTSLPPPLETRYSNVWPVTLNSKDGPKLVIGAQSFNALVTSSIRLDQVARPTVGAVTTNFQLTRIEYSLSTMIYLDQESIDKAMDLAKNADARSVTNSNLLDQLRQLNTKFNAPSSYYLCRASGPITKSHQCHPYSMFTLTDFDRGRNPASKIFANIAVNVLKYGDQAKLGKALVEECVLNSNGKTQSILKEIDSLFTDTQHVSILTNRDLNQILEKLANLLHPYIITANNSVEEAILQSFDYFKS